MSLPFYDSDGRAETGRLPWAAVRDPVFVWQPGNGPTGTQSKPATGTPDGTLEEKRAAVSPISTAVDKARALLGDTAIAVAIVAGVVAILAFILRR